MNFENFGIVQFVLHRVSIFVYAKFVLIISACCCTYIDSDGQDAWGDIFENGSSNGVIGGIYRNEVDLGVGSFYNWYNAEFEVSNSIVKSGVRIMGPRPRYYC